MEGIYRLYSLTFTEDGQQMRHLDGRFLIHNGYLRILEDSGGNLHKFLPPGEMTPLVTERLDRVRRSGYYELLHEDALHSGVHPDHVPELDFGDADAHPEATFTVSGPSLPAPQHLEVWQDSVILDGKKMSDDEVKVLMSAVELKKLVLTPHQ